MLKIEKIIYLCARLRLDDYFYTHFMNKITKLLSLAASLCLIAVSCDDKNSTTPDKPNKPDQPSEQGPTIKDVLAGEIGSTFEVKGALVVGANTNGVLLEQDGERIYAFYGSEHGLANGDVVTVNGPTAMRNGLPQFASGCTLSKTGTKEVVYPESKTLSVEDIDNYMKNPSVEYVTFTGTILLSGNYTNVELEGTSYIGSLDYMTEDFKAAYSGHNVTITGWAFGSYKSYFYVIPVKVEDHGVYEEEVPAGAIYYNTFDKDLATQTFGEGGNWPFMDEFDGWKNEKGAGVQNVSYSFQSMSIRTNQSSKGYLSEYEGSGKNNIFFGTAPNFFTIEKVDVTGNRDLHLQFGAQRYSQGGTNTFIRPDFEVRLSADGEVWSPALNYDFGDVEDVAGNWRLATADFTLPEGTNTLYIKFVAKLSSVNRLDDVLLIPGKGGKLVEFGKEDEIPLSTIAEVLASPIEEKYKVEGTIIGTHQKGFLVQDKTGIILTFKKKHGMSVGDVVTLEGVTTVYGGMKQFGESTVVTKNGTATVTYPEPVEFKAADFDAYAAAPCIKYITYTGDLTATRDQYYQWHHNVAVEGTAVVGSLSYPNNDLNVKDLENKKVTVTGYAIAVSGSDVKYLNTMVIEIKEAK